MEADNRGFVTGWSLWLTWIFIVFSVLGLVAAGLVVLVGPQALANALGIAVFVPDLTVGWAIEQLVGLALATTCVGVLLRELSWAKLAVACAWLMVLIESARSLYALFSSRALVVPFGVVLYAGFAMKLGRTLREQQRRADKERRLGRSGAGQV